MGVLRAANARMQQHENPQPTKPRWAAAAGAAAASSMGQQQQPASPLPASAGLYMYAALLCSHLVLNRPARLMTLGTSWCLAANITALMPPLLQGSTGSQQGAVLWRRGAAGPPNLGAAPTTQPFRKHAGIGAPAQHLLWLHFTESQPAQTCRHVGTTRLLQELHCLQLRPTCGPAGIRRACRCCA